MPIERMVVTNHERWGNLVKTWSTGKNYLEDNNEYPIPTSVDEFKEQLAKAQVFMTVPERYTQIKFVAQDIDTIVVRLPPKFAIEDSEERLSKPGARTPQGATTLCSRRGCGRCYRAVSARVCGSSPIWARPTRSPPPDA